MDTFLLTRFCGHIFEDTFLWTHFCGHIFVDTFLWTHFCGHIFVDTMEGEVVCGARYAISDCLVESSIVRPNCCLHYKLQLHYASFTFRNIITIRQILSW